MKGSGDSTQTSKDRRTGDWSKDVRKRYKYDKELDYKNMKCHFQEQLKGD